MSNVHTAGAVAAAGPPDHDHRRRRGARVLRRTTAVLATTLAAVVCGLCALLLVGVAAPHVPVIGTVGTFVLPPLAGPFLLVALLGSASALLAARLGVRRTGTVLAGVGLLSALGSGLVLSGQVQAGERAGADIDVARTFDPRLIAGTSAPDETVTYTTADGQALTIDLYLPNGQNDTGVDAGGAAAEHPVVMYVHGGGWTSGSPGDQAGNLRWFADHGYLAVAPAYVLATDGHATWDTANAQVACALQWVTAHAATYGGDPQRLFAWGESAGGALALSTTYAAAQGSAASSCGGAVPTVRAVAAMYPGVDPAGIYSNPDLLLGPAGRGFVRSYLGGSPQQYPDRLRAVTTTNVVNSAVPPTLLMLSDDDHLVPIKGALDLARIARAAGVPVRTVNS